MLFYMRTTTKYILGLLTALTFTAVQPVWAAGPPSPSVFNNPLALTFMILMLLLLVIIGILANILIGNDADNTLSGGTGNDALIGGLGDDT